MHTSIASRARSRPRQLASLCAACARLATKSSSSSSSSSLPNTKAASLPQRPSVSPPRPRARLPARSVPASAPAPAPPTTRRFSSGRAAASPASQDAAADEGPSTHQQKQLQLQQQSSEPDYYALFPQTLPAGPPPDGPFEIDVRALRREFLQLQAAVHPDFHHHAASSSSSSPSPGGSSSSSSSSSRHSAARRQAEAASAHVNAAYKTLASPLLRAQYLLRRRHGIDLAGDEAASLAAPDAALLAQVMAVQEDIEDAVASDEEEEKGLVAVREANDARVAADEAALAEAFARDDKAAAVAHAVRLRYWLNVRETLDNVA